MQPTCAAPIKCPKSPLARIDFGTRYGYMAITSIRVLQILHTTSFFRRHGPLKFKKKFNIDDLGL